MPEPTTTGTFPGHLRPGGWDPGPWAPTDLHRTSVEPQRPPGAALTCLVTVSWSWTWMLRTRFFKFFLSSLVNRTMRCLLGSAVSNTTAEPFLLCFNVDRAIRVSASQSNPFFNGIISYVVWKGLIFKNVKWQGSERMSRKKEFTPDTHGGVARPGRHITNTPGLSSPPPPFLQTISFNYRAVKAPNNLLSQGDGGHSCSGG